MRHLKSLTLTASVLGLSAVALPQQAMAQDNGFSFYGHLNFGVLNVDDGSETETLFVDNDNSNTRVGFFWENGLSDGSNVKFNFETALGLTGSSQVNADDNDFEFDWDKTELRKVEFIFSNERLGTLFLGQGSMSTDGVAELDMSGTTLASYASITDLNGGYAFRPGGGDPSSTTIGSVFSDFDGARRMRVRYDTPTLAGFTLSGSYGQEVLTSGNDLDYYDIAAKYAQDYGDLSVAGSLGYSWVGNDEELLLGSVAMLHNPTGLSASISTGSQQEGDADYYFLKLGYQRDWFSIGKTALSVDYYDGSDFQTRGSDSETWAVAAVQNIDNYNLELFAVYRSNSFDSSDTDFKDIDSVMFGARWKF